MRINNISVPDVYTRESADFRLFLKWFEIALTKVHYDTENFLDLYDPLKCPDWLLWMLADTVGYKYDDRLSAAFNRLVILYFMSMIRNRGSKDGITLAAETNLAQFNILNYGKENDILFNRLEDTSIPVNSVYVTPHVEEGYIEVVYFSEKVPIDACIEYVRPIGMYVFQSAGVRFDARTKITIDARLCNSPTELNVSIGPTHVGHYSRKDYAAMQKIDESELCGQYNSFIPDPRFENFPSRTTSKREAYQSQSHEVSLNHERDAVYYRNSKYEVDPTPNDVSEKINPGWRALYSLQMCNNEHIVESLLPNKIFGIGYAPPGEVELNVEGYLPDVAYEPEKSGRIRPWNLRYDKYSEQDHGYDVYTMDSSLDYSTVPAVNPIMSSIGDAILNDDNNTEYIMGGEFYTWSSRSHIEPKDD